MNMLSTTEQDYVIGESAVLPLGRPVEQEKKSAPLSAFLPERSRYEQIAPQRYFDPAFADLEWERLWTRVWLCAGRVSDVAERNSWFRFDFARESFIISRSGKDEITAVYNVCQHRGNRLVDDDFGYNGKGGTNVRGHHIKAWYRPFDPMQVVVSYFITEAINTSGNLHPRQQRLFFDLL